MVQPVLWLIALAIGLVGELRRTGPAGRRRFDALDPVRARKVVDQYRLRWIPWNLGLWAIVNAVYLLVGLTQNDPAGATTGGAAAVLAVALLGLRRHNQPLILAAAETRELADPENVEIGPRDTSLSRRRRQRQFGAVAIGALLLFPVAITVAELIGSTVLLVLGLLVLLLAALTGAAFGWASVWVYGDEQPAA